MKATFLGLVLCAALAATRATCPLNIQSQQVFDPTKYMGTWYLISTYKIPSPSDIRCASYNFSLTKDKKLVNVTQHGIISPNSSFVYSFNATVNSTVPSQWSADSLSDEYHYHVLLTDYSTFAVHYLCISYPVPYAENWVTTGILSRKRVLAADQMHILETLLSGYGFEVSDRRLIDQTNC